MAPSKSSVFWSETPAAKNRCAWLFVSAFGGASGSQWALCGKPHRNKVKRRRNARITLGSPRRGRVYHSKTSEKKVFFPDLPNVVAGFGAAAEFAGLTFAALFGAGLAGWGFASVEVESVTVGAGGRGGGWVADGCAGGGGDDLATAALGMWKAAGP